MIMDSDHKIGKSFDNNYLKVQQQVKDNVICISMANKASDVIGSCKKENYKSEEHGTERRNYRSKNAIIQSLKSFYL